MSALSSVYKYQYDDSGVSAANLITNETRTVIASDPTVFVPFEGLYYSESLVVRNGGTTLVRGVDYEVEAFDDYFTARTGKGVYGGIKRLSAAMLGTISIDYQCLGGPEGQANSFVLSLKEAIDNAIANPSVDWNDIINKPSAFTPAQHKHYPSDLEDLDLLAQKFDDFIDAIVSVRFYRDSNHSLHNEILRHVAVSGSLRNSINAIAAMTGTANDILDLKNRLDGISREVTSNIALVTGVPAEVYSIPQADYNSIVVGLLLVANDDSAVLKTDISVVRMGNINKYTLLNGNSHGGYDTIVNPDSTDILISDTGPNLTITVTPKIDCKIVIKELEVM